MILRSAFYIFFAATMNACVFSGPTQHELFSIALSRKPYDVIIVPGVPHDTASDNWDLVMKGRVYWSRFLYEKGITKNIIYSGGAVYTPFYEGEIMSIYALQLGIPQENIYIETRAEHSTENVYYSYYLAKKLGFHKIAVATDPFQAGMLRNYPKLMRMKLDFIPFVVDSLKRIDKRAFVKLPGHQNRVEPFVSLADRESRFKRFWGTLGKNIVKEEEDERVIRKRKKKKKEN